MRRSHDSPRDTVSSTDTVMARTACGQHVLDILCGEVNRGVGPVARQLGATPPTLALAGE